MTIYRGKAATLDGAIQQAAQNAVADIGPDALVHFKLTDVHGSFGGIAGIHEVEAEICVHAPDPKPR